jgi:ubiquinone/menaquinone biosynthesis C-methylase UbiE
MKTVSSEFKTKDAASYNSLTGEFDRSTLRLSLPFAEHLVRLANLEANDSVLDVGTGTGVVAVLAVGKLGSGGKVTGVDLSAEMLVAARSKALRDGLENRIQFSRLDAEALAFRDRSFDVVFSLFALLHLPDPQTALKEMFRVLRPGGRLILAVGSRPSIVSAAGVGEGLRYIRRGFAMRQRKLLIGPQSLDDFLARRIPGSDQGEEAPIARESKNRSHKIPRLIRQAQFTNVCCHWRGAEARFETPEEFWEVQRTFSSIARKRLLRTSSEKIDNLRQEYLEDCRKVQSRGGTFVYPFGALFAVAQRPVTSNRVGLQSR